MRLRRDAYVHAEKNGHLHRICARWLVRNFGYRGSITSVKILKKNWMDAICGIVRVKFKFKGPGGSIGDGVAFLNQEEVAHAGI